MTDQLSSHPPTRIRLWSLREDVLVEDDPGDDDSLVLFARWGEIHLPGLDTFVRDWLRRMSLGPVALENVLSQPERDSTDNPEYIELMRVLERISGVIVHSVGRYGEPGPLVSAVPIVRDAEFVLPDLGSGDVVRLSRFAVVRSSEGTLVVESGLAGYRVVLHRQLAISLLGQLAGDVRLDDLESSLESAQVEVQRDVVSNLVAAGVAVVAQPDPESGEPVFNEDVDPSLTPWSYHDLLFHTRSTPGRTDAPLGAPPDPSDQGLPTPATKPAPLDKRYPLYRPLSEDLTHGPSPKEAVVSWRAYRKFGPITADALGELLHRAVRDRRFPHVRGLGSGAGATTGRRRPGMGEVHALNLHLTLDRCFGMPRGSYRYDPGAHALTWTSASDSAIAEMLDGARIAGGLPQRPPALITMSAPISHLSMLCTGNAYAMALTQVGLLQETMSRVATAMGLAPHALPMGGGAYAIAPLELDWPAEVVVGEFAIGTKP